MKIMVSTDNNIEEPGKLIAYVTLMLESALTRFNVLVTRVDVHLSDQNGDKIGQDDKRCMMEARLKGRRPTTAAHQAATLSQAIDGATDKLIGSLESTMERMQDHGARESRGARDRFHQSEMLAESPGATYPIK